MRGILGVSLVLAGVISRGAGDVQKLHAGHLVRVLPVEGADRVRRECCEAVAESASIPPIRRLLASGGIDERP